MKEKMREMIQAIRDYYGADKSHWIQHLQYVDNGDKDPSYCIFGAAKAFAQGSLGDLTKEYSWSTYDEAGTKLATELGFEDPDGNLVYQMANWNNSTTYQEILDRLDEALLEEAA